jgi:hypothetical protein
MAAEVIAMNRARFLPLTAAGIAVALVLGLGGGCTSDPIATLHLWSENGSDWIAVRTDSICGLDDAARLSNPAVVQYAALLEATPEQKRIRAENIDPSSALGIQLAQRAVDRVRDACEFVRVKEGHCSVWKRLRHKDGRHVPDLTASVKAIVSPPKDE